MINNKDMTPKDLADRSIYFIETLIGDIIKDDDLEMFGLNPAIIKVKDQRWAYEIYVVRIS